jgi:formylglycine-generating enzyme required for sulfatase activity
MEVDVGGGVKMKLVYVEPGKFTMGSPKEEKGQGRDELQHEVEITKGFWMGAFEVTQEEYEKVMGKNPAFFKGKRLPVEQVSWEGAMEFCKQLSKKARKTFDLPTEAEWEYACRAGSKEKFHYGNSLSSKQANIADKAPFLDKTTKVGPYKPNAFGLYDMHGNVEEWCKDWYEKDYSCKESPLRDPQGPKAGKARVARGGSWGVSAGYCRSANRQVVELDNSVCPPVTSTHNGQGFRVVGRFPWDEKGTYLFIWT